MNAEVVRRLEQSFEKNLGDLDSVPTEQLMKELAKRCSILEIKMR
ncbi:hypothetical protein [Acinetobacter baumannii]|nr:hypothetical protein [Acinetobacter baumannii]MCL6164504.1 hypothetical protein [Acinetobacter baumannii]MCL6167724.1 hypothetical protein [Acinetobacter baumannii]MCL6172070.1 hypothetical protein [Acinetobacter baumannii]MCL6195969.1 hypothetical protein [Acinetobacter baumannii]